MTSVSAIARITLNRPAERNPIGLDFTTLMLSAIDKLEADPDCRVVILTGKGAAFRGGADLARGL